MFKNKTVFAAYFKPRIFRDEKIQENEKVVKSYEKRKPMNIILYGDGRKVFG